MSTIDWKARAEAAEAERDALASQNAALRTALGEARRRLKLHGFTPCAEVNSAFALTPPAALDDLRRRERSIGAEESEVEKIVGRCIESYAEFWKAGLGWESPQKNAYHAAQQELLTYIRAQAVIRLRADAIAAERKEGE